nr:hypothetical protein [Tanacetum cinerariifolium]
MVVHLSKSDTSARFDQIVDFLNAQVIQYALSLVDIETEVDLGAELQGRLEEKYEVNAAIKEVNAAEPIVFDDEEVRPIFEREYNKVQTFLKSDRDEEPTKKRVAKEILLQESFK